MRGLSYVYPTITTYYETDFLATLLEKAVSMGESIDRVKYLRRHFAFLSKHCDTNETFEYNQPNLDQVRTFVFGNSEDANLVLFWSKRFSATFGIVPFTVENLHGRYCWTL